MYFKVKYSKGGCMKLFDIFARNCAAIISTVALAQAAFAQTASDTVSFVNF